MTTRLLIVDDEPQNAATIQAHLGVHTPGSEYTTTVVTCGADAIAALIGQRPDLVLLALTLPDSSGLAILARIREQTRMQNMPHLPVIFLTTPAERDHRARALEAGADEFLEKPFDGALLRARVRMLLQLRDSRDELRRSRDALHERNRELEHLQCEQRELMEFLVHDLKNPLMVVSGNLEFLGSARGVPERLLGAVNDARDATERLRTLVQDLLTVSHLDHAQLPLRREPVDIVGVVRAVVGVYLRKANERGISLVVGNAPPLLVSGDSGLLHRVVENIVDNSFRYTPSGGRISIEMCADSASQVTVAISNSGPAIPKEQRARIFEKFVRSGENAVIAANVGIGLYFCKRVVDAHGGAIDVAETAEWPTSFIVTLPRA